MEITWDNITIEKYKELFYTKIENFDSYLEWKIEIISILYNIDIYDNDNMDIDELNEYYQKINTILNSSPSQNNITKLNDYYLKPFEELLFCEFIDLDYYFKESYIDNLELILAILFKKKIIDNNGNLVFEPNEYKYDDRTYLFNNLYINDVYGIITKYIKYKEYIYSVYKSIFFKDDTNIETDDEFEQLTGIEKKQYLIEKKKEEQKSQFAWEIILHKLSNGDITKEDQILNMPVVRIFNKLSMLDILK